MDEFERAVAEIEKVVYDETFTTAIADLRTDADALHNDPFGNEDAVKLIRLHEHQWTKHELLYKKMHFTGSFYKSDSHDDLLHAEFDESARLDLDDHPVRITGFAIQTVLSDKNGDFALRQRLLMTARAKVEDPDENDGMAFHEGFIPVTPEMQLDYNELTPDKAKAWLAAYYPELRSDVDTCLFSAEDEAEATLNLKSLDFDLASISKKERKSILKKLDVYVNGVVKYNTPVPYGCVVSGELVHLNSSAVKHNSVTHETEALLLAQELRFSIDDLNEKLLINLAAFVVRDRGQKPVVTQLRISSIQRMIPGTPLYDRALE